MVKILAVILLVLMLAVGRDRGLQAFLTILMNVGILAAVLYAITLGISPLPVSAIAGMLLTVLILFYQNGYNLKTKVAFAVILAVEIILFLIGMILCCKGHAGGYSEINLDEGLFLDGNVGLSMLQVEIAVILLSLLGAIKDAAVAVTSAVYEVHENNLSLLPSQLFGSGLKIGREILATTMNTLFFACVGESLLLFNIICYWGYSFGYILNSKALFQVLLYTGIAAIGCIAAIPLAAIAMAMALKRRDGTGAPPRGQHTEGEA